MSIAKQRVVMPMVYVSDQLSGFSRRRCGKGFVYRLPDGSRLVDEQQLSRIRSLAIPPAYRQVWICPIAEGHLQATGRDARGRKQYRYHAQWREARDADKFARLLAFAHALPRIRERVKRDLARPVNQRVMRDSVLATIVRLLDTTLVRVGNEEYAHNNNSFGLTTLRHWKAFTILSASAFDDNMPMYGLKFPALHNSETAASLSMT